MFNWIIIYLVIGLVVTAFIFLTNEKSRTLLLAGIVITLLWPAFLIIIVLSILDSSSCRMLQKRLNGEAKE